MIINGIDVRSAFGVREWNLEPSYVSMSNKSEWSAGAALPNLLNTSTGLKTQKVKVMIKGRSREDMWDKAGKLIAALMTPSVVQFRDFKERYFRCVLANAEHAERSLRRFPTATLELVGYEYGIERTFESSSGSMTIYNIGTMKTPCIFSITPPETVTGLTVSGLLRDPYTGAAETITFSSLTAGKELIIDPFAGTVMEGTLNRFSNVSMSEWPALVPGQNIITASRNDVTMKVTFSPFYL